MFHRVKMEGNVLVVCVNVPAHSKELVVRKVIDKFYVVALYVLVIQCLMYVIHVSY